MTQDLSSPYGPAGYQQQVGSVRMVNVVGGAGAAFSPSTPAAWNPAPSTLAAALDELTLERTTFVFRPNEPAPVGNVFATWATLYAATLVTPGPKQIVFDSTLAAIAIPVGAYDFGRNCAFVGVVTAVNSTSTQRVEITCPQGVTFTTPILSLDDVRLTYTGTGALMTVPGTGRVVNFYMRNQARTNSSGSGGRIFDVPSGAIFAASLYDNSAIIVSGGGLFWNVLAGAVEADINALGAGVVNGVVPVNCLAGVAGPVYAFSAQRLALFQAGTATVPASQQAGMPGGTVTPTFTGSIGVASNVQYTPATPAQWVAPAPNNVKAALDRIAAVVSVGGATPIP